MNNLKLSPITFILAIITLLLISSNVSAQKCKNNKNFRELKEKFENEEYYEGKKIADLILLSDSSCTEALYLRAIIHKKLKNNNLVAIDLSKLQTANSLNSNELEICGDLADSIAYFEQAIFFYRKSFLLSIKNKNSIFLKILEARFKNGEAELIFPIVDSLIRAQVTPNEVNIATRKLKVHLLQKLYEQSKNKEDKINYENELRNAHIGYLRKNWEYFGNPNTKLPLELTSSNYCETYMLIATNYYYNGQYDFTLRYLDYLQQSECNSTYNFLNDSLSFLTFKNQKNKEKTNYFLLICLDKKPNSTFFLRMKTEYLLELGEYYLTAIEPLNRALKIFPLDSSNLFYRAMIYEKNQDFAGAFSDMTLIQKTYGVEAYASDYKRIYHLHFESKREYNPPKLQIDDPVTLNNKKYKISIENDQKTISISGVIKDQSEVSELSIYGKLIPLEIQESGDFRFNDKIEIPESVKTIMCIYKDVYENTDTTFVDIKRFVPGRLIKIKLNNPPNYSKENLKEVYIDPSQEKHILFNGTIESRNEINSITVNGVPAKFEEKFNNSYSFEVSIQPNNNDSIVTIGYKVADYDEAFFNFKINKIDAEESQEQFSGRTWAIIISNSEYDNFNKLEGVENDILMIDQSLRDYSIQKILKFKNMKISEMNSFFRTELKNQLKNAQVSTLLIWYAGHGKYSAVDETSYWIPIDADSEVNDQYFALNDLKQTLNNVNYLSNVLIVSDACETGMSFLDTKRGSEIFDTCENTLIETGKSFYGLTSASDKGTSDNSKLCELFSMHLKNRLKGNSNCVNLLDVADKVNEELIKLKLEPKFGMLTDLICRKNTSFFIEKKRKNR